MKKHKNTFAKFCQFIYLSFSNFTKNNLWDKIGSWSGADWEQIVPQTRQNI